MSEPIRWYGEDEIRRWDEAATHGFGEHAEWLTFHLNAAFNKGRQMQNQTIINAIDALTLDMHHPSTRPCRTCQNITNAIGHPFGCIQYAASRKQATP